MHSLQGIGLKVLRYFGSAAKAAADSLTKKLFLATYEASDDAFWRHHAGEYEWRKLGGIIEYTPDLLAMPGEQDEPVYALTIRATSGMNLQRVAIKVKKKQSGIIHEQKISQERLCSVPVRKALDAIPLKSKRSRNTAPNRLGDLYIKLEIAVNDQGVDLVKGRKIAEIFGSKKTDSAHHDQVARWGQYWNVDLINSEKESIKTRCYRELVQSARNLGRPLTMRRMAYRVLTSQIGLILTFWSQNLFKADGIRASIAQADSTDRQNDGQRGRAASVIRNAAHPDRSIGGGS
jgi:hypothetical protein